MRSPNERPPHEHKLAVAQSVILGGFLCFLCIVLLFALDLRFAGKAVDVGTTAYIINATSQTCNFTAKTGYNIVSVPCLSTATPIADVINPSSVVAIYQYVPNDPDSWRVYNPNLPSYVVSDLAYISRRPGYIALMRTPESRTINGIEPLYTTISLVPGWNLVGYPSHTTRNASDAFSLINASFTRAMTYDKPTEAFVQYDNPSGGTLRNVTPGSGYWINATANAMWTVYP
jgi:hypothetical protein